MCKVCNSLNASNWYEFLFYNYEWDNPLKFSIPFHRKSHCSCNYIYTLFGLHTSQLQVMHILQVNIATRTGLIGWIFIRFSNIKQSMLYKRNIFSVLTKWCYCYIKMICVINYVLYITCSNLFVTKTFVIVQIFYFRVTDGHICFKALWVQNSGMHNLKMEIRRKLN